MGAGRRVRRMRTFIQRGIILGGLGAILGCPQATSSQVTQTPLMATGEASTVLASAVSEVPVTPEVCSFQPDWQRPTEEDQAKYLAADPRFASAVEAGHLKATADNFWQNDILSFTTYGLSARMEPMLLSGLWSAADQVWESCYGADQATALNDGDLAETWLVGYRLVDVQWQDDRYVMTVEPADAGLQVVHFNRVDEGTTLPIQVLDAAGSEVAVVSGDYE